MTDFDRRKFLWWSAAAAAGLSSPSLAMGDSRWGASRWGVAANPDPAVPAAEKPGSFDFVFLTDTHIQPELDAAHGCAMCFSKIHAMGSAAGGPDFVIQGGDHVFDSLGVPETRATSLFDLYARTEQTLGMQVHHTIGNHDVFGVLNKSGASPSDPLYGKRMYEDRMGKTYYSFDHKGYHFVVLDSIQITGERMWTGGIDAAQKKWLAADLAKTPAAMPIVVVVHVPLVTGSLSYVTPRGGGPLDVSGFVVMNAWEILPMLEDRRVLGVLQGHVHINEVIEFHGFKFITCGAVSGNWWHGLRLGVPEGFTVVSLREGMMTWRYETYGFNSVDPHNT